MWLFLLPLQLFTDIGNHASESTKRRRQLDAPLSRSSRADAALTMFIGSGHARLI
jgi:hypothetical protein